MVSMSLAQTAQRHLVLFAALVGAVAAREVGAETNNLICGGTQIHKLLTANPSVDGIRNTPWSKIMAIVDEYLKEQDRAIPQLTQEVERLKADIAQKESMEAKTPASEEQFTALITASVTEQGSFGSIENAKASECGAAKPAVRRKLTPPVKVGTFKKCTAAFSTKATEFFNGGVSAQGSEFRKVCDKLLPGDLAGDTASYCDELCQSFADVVQQLSDSTVGAHAGTASALLKETLQEKIVKLQTAQLELSECKGAKETLEGFRSQLDSMQKDVKVEFEKVQDAREALAEAEDLVLDLEDDLEEKSRATEEAIKVLKGAGEKVTAARKAFDLVRSTELELKLKVKTGKSRLEAAKRELDVAHEADSCAQQVKGLVTQTMLNMALLFNEAVLEPVRTLGLGADTSVDQYFQAQPNSLPAASEFKTAMTTLEDYCQKEAKPAFAALDSKKLDLNPLCEFGGVSAVVKDVDAAVVSRMENVKKQLKGVQAWLNPYYPQKTMTKEMVEQFIKEGEPVGLREVVGVFHKASYYTGYLKKWQRGKKYSFLALYKELGTAIEKLSKEHAQVSDDLQKLVSQVQEIVQQRDDAQKKLDDAIKANDVAAANKAQAQTLLEEAQEEAKKAKDNFDALRKAAEEAIKRYNDAKALLQETHRKGTSMLQFLDEVFEADEEPAAADAGRLQPVRPAM